jgi:signal transduction histidine kinase/DNA-binding response OmpR family regulator/HPt (histidine-containing phosphotransfer) domain-containing protein
LFEDFIAGICFFDIVDWFIYINFNSKTTNSIMQNLNNIKVFSLLFSGLIAVQMVLFFKMGAVSLFFLSSLIFLVMLVNAFAYGKYKDRLAGHILNAALVIYTAGLCYKTGGFYSISIFMLFFVPLFISVFLNTTDKIVYLCLAAAILLIFYLGQSFNIRILFSDQLVNLSYFRLSNFLAMLVVFSSAILIFTFNARTADQLLEQSRQKCRQISVNANQNMKIKNEFLANMSHEIRNPMNGIIGMMHVLLDSDLNEEQEKYSKIVYNSARALLTIVNDILDLSKIEAGKLELDIRDFDLDIAMKDIVSLPELQARQKGIDFSYTIDPDVPCLLRGDIGRIRQVINNLTGNAVKFTGSGEVMLNVSLESDAETQARLHFSVDDTGIGIKEDKIDTLFDSFTQADLSITKKYGGTGLGLSISKLLVEKMDGEIGVESIENIGSTFWFTLSLKKQPEKEKTVDVSIQKTDECKVLVLSDGSSLGITFEKNLIALELNYEQAFDETEAMEMLKWARDEENPFDMVIMEAKESDITAKNFGKKIKQDDRFRQTKLILLTSIGKKGDARRFEEIGFSAFLSKPVERSLLLDCIKTVLSQPHGTGGFHQPIITRYSIIEDKKQNRLILIVEDMETNLITAKILIGKLGYQTDEARNGLEAVQKHKTTHYDMILMDCQMPMMDGLEATRQIRKTEKALNMNHVPIIAMTGNAFASDREKCFSAGMDDFISKPVEPNILAQKISSNLTGASIHVPEDKSEPNDILPESVPEAAPCINDETDLCFNKDKLFQRFEKDEEIINVVLDSFFEEAPELLEKIKQAMVEKEAEAVRLNSHALKGSAANVNADLLRNAAFDMETDAKAGYSDSFGVKFKKIQREYIRFIEEAKLT